MKESLGKEKNLAMSELAIICRSFKIGSVILPDFKVKKGHFLCLHWPLSSGSLEEERFLKILLGTKTEINPKVLGKIIKVVNFLYKKKKFFSYPFSVPTIERFLIESSNIDTKQVSNILIKLNIAPHSHINSMSLTTRKLLELELAWVNSPEVVLFKTSGLDPLGINAVYQAVLEKLDTCAAIHFSYPTLPTRICCSQSQCLEVKQAHFT